MPQFQRGDIWSVYEQADLFLITTNATLKGNGALVMGRGLARQARDRFSGLDMAWGQAIAGRCGHLGRYHLLVSPHWPRAKLGAFQVKQDYRHQADPRLIRKSVAALSGWCAAHPGAQVALNFPGIGNGRLSRSAVLPIIAQLPDQVTIWEYPPDVAPAAAPPAVFGQEARAGFHPPGLHHQRAGGPNTQGGDYQRIVIVPPALFIALLDSSIGEI